MNNLLSCGKLVKNMVEKSVKKSWNLFVQKRKMGISNNSFTHSMWKFSTFTRGCVEKLNKFCTENLWVSNLLNVSFPLFPQTSTITTTNYLINKKGY